MGKQQCIVSNNDISSDLMLSLCLASCYLYVHTSTLTLIIQQGSVLLKHSQQPNNETYRLLWSFLSNGKSRACYSS